MLKAHDPATCVLKGLYGRDCTRCATWRQRKAARSGPFRRTWHIVRINCDCGSTVAAKTSIHWMYGPRRPCCGKYVGCLAWEAVAKVRAAGSFAALKEYERLKASRNPFKTKDIT